MKKIMLHGKYGEGKFALVDNADFEWLNKYKWFATPFGHPIRGERHGGRKGLYCNIFMHREIMKMPKGKFTDHINRNPLDNRKTNLRICTLRENTYNSKNRTGHPLYKGLNWLERLQKWQVRIRNEYLGVFKSDKEAALAYNQAATKYFGEFAKLNDI